MKLYKTMVWFEDGSGWPSFRKTATAAEAIEKSIRGWVVSPETHTTKPITRVDVEVVETVGEEQ